MEELALHLLHKYGIFIFYALVGKILCSQVYYFILLGEVQLHLHILHIASYLCKTRRLILTKAGIVLKAKFLSFTQLALCY